ncbi:MAG: sterol desaturase family protein [Sphingomonadales bacterium]|nr:sterol desaturase family protein [Sphingomonadales bacterium]MBD3772121.1 sterol desaturase family protein [Paracoccaceae bacterium]MBD3814099.1 sterol desaturase family protein [Betaproteobacteria bacterium]
MTGATVLLIVLEVLGGWLLADFLSGFLHWVEDRYGRESWPLIGKKVIGPNRQHHSEPLAFTRTDPITRNWSAALASFVLAMPLLLLFGPHLWLVVAFIGGCIANEVHYWAHLPHRAPGIVQALQVAGLCQSRRQHALHHAAPHLSNYCSLTDWLNPWLDRIGFWHFLERLLPNRWLA